MGKQYIYILKDVNNSILSIASCKYDIVTEKRKLISHYREYKVPHLSKYLKIEKKERKTICLMN